MILKMRMPTKDFKACVDAVSILVGEARVKISKTGVRLLAVEAANVAMVGLTIPAENCITYNYDMIGEEGFDGKTEVEVGIDFASLSKVLEEVDATFVDVTVDSTKIYIIAGVVAVDFDLMELVKLRREPKLLDLNLPVKAKIPAGQLLTLVKVADQIRTTIRFSTAGEALVVRAESDTIRMAPRIEKAVIERGNINKEVSSFFSLEYFKDIAKTLETWGDVILELGDGYPIRIKAYGAGEVEYWLAPRIESE